MQAPDLRPNRRPGLIRFADDSQHDVILGRNGTGKTQYGLWRLAHRSWGKDTPLDGDSRYTRKPWIIFDAKGDELIADIDPEEIRVGGKVPNKPGLYVVRYVPDYDDDAVASMMREIWTQEHTGVFIDEGYEIPQSRGLRSLYTSGRSKRTPVMTLSQRPVFLSRFVWSEAAFFTVFNLSTEDDRKSVTGYIPVSKHFRLEEFYSFYYDKIKDFLTQFSPAPASATILDIYRSRMERKRAWI